MKSAMRFRRTYGERGAHATLIDDRPTSYGLKADITSLALNMKETPYTTK
jgi:hypothetical protein